MRNKFVKIGVISALYAALAAACAPVDDMNDGEGGAAAIGTQESALSACSCSGGTDHRGLSIPASSTYCGFRVCGSDHKNYECTLSGWTYVSGSSCGYGDCKCYNGSDDQGRSIDPNATECGYRVCGGDHQFYDCKSSGWLGTGLTCSSTDSGSSSSSSSSSSGGGTSPLCLSSQAGAYCGNDMMQNADANTLYQCPGANLPPTSSQYCTNGCVVAASGYPDYCQSGGGTATGYRLPWHAGVPMQLTQDCNDSCCNDHVGNDKYAWDFGNTAEFTVVATRGGTITHLKSNSTYGCGSSSCMNYANYLVIDHGDGTQSTYLHLKGFSLKSGIYCGAVVSRGQELATAGTTGWSTGVHLHYEVSKVHTGAATCECGTNGQGCSTNTVNWNLFWPDATYYPTQAISFDEWPSASSCANRRINPMPGSLN